MDERSEKKANKYRERDNTYSVEKTAGTTIEELIDGIRDKIQHTLEDKQSTSGSGSRE